MVGAAHASTSPHRSPSPPKEGNATGEDAPLKTMTQGEIGSEKGGGYGRGKKGKRREFRLWKREDLDQAAKLHALTYLYSLLFRCRGTSELL